MAECDVDCVPRVLRDIAVSAVHQKAWNAPVETDSLPAALTHSLRTSTDQSAPPLICSVYMRVAQLPFMCSAEDESKPAAPGGAKPAEELTPEEIARREAKKKAKEEEKVWRYSLFRFSFFFFLQSCAL